MRNVHIFDVLRQDTGIKNDKYAYRYAKKNHYFVYY